MTESEAVSARAVRVFVNYRAAERDRLERTQVALLDMHGLWWSCPAELTLQDINAQAAVLLEQHGVRMFPPEPVRVARPDWQRA